MWAVGPYGRPSPQGVERVIIVTLRVWMIVYRDDIFIFDDISCTFKNGGQS